MLPYVFIALALLFLVLYLTKRAPDPQQQPVAKSKQPVSVDSAEEKVPLGRVRIYFGSQTGTAAKLA